MWTQRSVSQQRRRKYLPSCTQHGLTRIQFTGPLFWQVKWWDMHCCFIALFCFIILSHSFLFDCSNKWARRRMEQKSSRHEPGPLSFFILKRYFWPSWWSQEPPEKLHNTRDHESFSKSRNTTAWACSQSKRYLYCSSKSKQAKRAFKQRKLGDFGSILR